MKKVKRFLSVLCCMVLIASMTIDVYAAEGISSLLTETEDETPQSEMQEDEDKKEVETESQNTLDETKPEEESDNKETQNTEVQSTTETEKDSSEVAGSTEVQEQETVSETVYETAVDTDSNENGTTAESEEILTETETETDGEEEVETDENLNDSSTRAAAVNHILDDVYVSNMSSASENNYAESETLIFGKFRHIYLRFDLTKISKSAEKISFQGSWAKGSRTSVVVKESSEFLRTDDTTDSADKWTRNNVNYSNRPLDKETIYDELAWTAGPLEIDLTTFIKDKIANGDTTACVHITTLTVDNDKIGAVEIHSSRATNESNWPKLVVEPTAVNGIFDDTYVDSSKPTNSNANATSLVFGKSRHLYFRFDLSNIPDDAESIIFSGTYNKGQREPIVVYECGENLRDGETESQTKWTASNVNYNNRPIDAENALYDSMAWPSGNLEIDLTEFIKAKKVEGADTACIHITTTKVDDSSVSAVEIFSSRNGTGKPKLVVTSASDEKPVEIAREIDGKDYYDNGVLIQKVVKIKTADNKYLKVGNDGTVSVTDNTDEADLFGIHIYQYDAYDYEANGEKIPSYGSTLRTFAFEQLSTGKFLTIQNYFAADDSDKAYYNKNGGKFTIKATALDVNYNERFVMKHYPDSDYYVISSHLEVYRDQSSAVSPLYVEDNTLKCGANENEFSFYLEEVEGQDKLKIMQEVNGTSVTLSWKPVNKDTEPANYTIEGQTVAYNDAANELSATITGLKEGLNTFKVSYSKDGYTTEAEVKVRKFKHMALTHSEAQLDAMKEHIQNKEEPWYSDYQLLLNQVPNDMSKSTYKPHTVKAIGRGDAPSHGNIGYLERDSNAAYFNALLWVITGEEEYAKTGVAILNAWSGLELLDGRDRILGAAISIYRMNNAAEILKYYHGGYSGYTDEEFRKYQNMLLNVIYPVIQDLGLPMIANGNWDTTALSAMITIGALCDNTEIFQRAVYLYDDIHTNGSICVYVSEWGQSVESFRDQAHAQLGISFLAEVCEVADKQDIDLYGLYDNRLAKAFNWAAWYSLYGDENEMKKQPLLPDVFGRARWPYIDHEKINRGELRSVYELPLAHYSQVDGVDVTWMKKAAEAMRPQGFVNNDHLNFGTLTTYNGEATEAAEPYFQLRTRLEDWYQRTWSQVEKYGSSEEHTVAETLNSYFKPDENGILTASVKKADAPYFQLRSQADGTYGIYCVTTGKYLSVKEDTYEDGNVIKADADSVGENEKFYFKATGLSYFYFESAKDNRILNVKVDGTGNDATLTLYLGKNVQNDSDKVSNNERFLIMYNTEDVALEGIAADTSELEDYINNLPDISNDDNKYTTESYQAFAEKLEAAKKCVQDAKNGKVSQTEVDNALQALRDAYENLEENKPTEEQKVLTPRANVESGEEILAGTDITLTCDTEGATIYYTTGTSDPSKDNGTLYVNPIPINEDTTIKAIAVKDGYKDSEIVTYVYTITKTDPDKFVYAPTANIPSGKVNKGTEIILTCDTEGAIIYYTIGESIPSATNGTKYETPIIVNETMTINAIAVKGENVSRIKTYAYEVSSGSSENPEEPEKPITVSMPTADKASGTELLLKGTKITLACDTEGATIYYTTDESVPSAEKGTKYENPIPVYKNTTINAIAVKGDATSKVATFNYTISVGLKVTVDGNSYSCSAGDAINTSVSYIYTGKAITPKITVVNNGERMTEGIDYTIKYANNINVPTEKTKQAQYPKITITGKNNLKGNAILYFTIKAKSIANSETGISAVDPLAVVENKKPTPTLYYNGLILKANKDFTIAPDDNRKLTAADDNREITLTGKGNYTGTRTVKVNVVNKSELKKFTVTVDAAMNAITYDGQAHEPVFTVSEAGTPITQDNNYYVVMSDDTVSAGTKKFTIVGIGMYTGCKVTKTYTIQPCTDSNSIKIEKALKETYNYTSSGVTFGAEDLIIIGSGNTLKEGKDYKITYRANKKVTDNAKYSITFLGNYKGAKNVENQTGTFKIAAADLANAQKEGRVKAVALNQIYKKPGTYKTKLYVSVDNVLLKASDYTVTYPDSKIDLGENTEDTVTIQIKGKGNYAGTIETTYKVCKADNLYDLSKAKVTVVDSNGSKLKNVQFDGNEQTVSLKIQIKDGKQYRELTSEEYNTLAPHITYVNNVYKGKASIVINSDGKQFAGSKAVTFSIVSKDITMKK